MSKEYDAFLKALREIEGEEKRIPEQSQKQTQNNDVSSILNSFEQIKKGNYNLPDQYAGAVKSLQPQSPQPIPFHPTPEQPMPGVAEPGATDPQTYQYMMDNPDLFPTEKQDPFPGLSQFTKDAGIVLQAAKILSDEDHRDWKQVGKDVYTGAQLARDVIVSAGGLLGGKEFRKQLGDRADEMYGFEGVAVKATAELTEKAIEWALIYPKLFQLAGFGNAQIARIPQVQKAFKAIEESGGVKHLAEKFPRMFQVAKNALDAAWKGFEVGSAVSTVEAVSDDMPFKEAVPHILAGGGKMAAVAGMFNLASSADKANYIAEMRQNMMRKVGRDVEALQKMSESEVRAYMQSVSAVEREMLANAASVNKKSGGITRNLGRMKGKHSQIETYQRHMTSEIENIVSSVESELHGITKGKLYGNIGGKVVPASEAAERFMRYNPSLRKSPFDFKSGTKGPENLKVGLNERLGLMSNIISFPLQDVQ